MFFSCIAQIGGFVPLAIVGASDVGSLVTESFGALSLFSSYYSTDMLAVGAFVFLTIAALLALAHSRNRAERAAEAARIAHTRLLDALEVVPEGFALFDAEDRYVAWNPRYSEIYSLSNIPIEKGMRFEDVLRAGLALGQHVVAKGREEEWIAERLALHVQARSNHEQQLADGRWVRVEERRTSDGGSVGVRIDITDLKQREESFRLLFDSNPIPMWVYDLDSFRFLAVNDAAVAHYGYSRERFLGMTLFDMRPAEDHEALRAFVQNSKGTDARGKYWRHTKADGANIDVQTFAQPLKYGGRDAALVCSIDITEQKRAELELQNTRAFLDAVIENVPAPIFVKSAKDFRYVLINRAGETFYGVPRAEMIGKTADEIYPESIAKTIRGFDQKCLESSEESFLADHPIYTPGNGMRFGTSRRIAIPDVNGKPQYLLGVMEDFTERKRAEARLEYMAHHDALTDLPNRMTFQEYFETTLGHAAAANEPFAVLSIDLDRFKEINDVFGHALGDTVLCEVSRRLQGCAEGAFLARIGGDEFGIVVSGGAQPQEAAKLGERLLAAANADYEIEGRHLRVGLSIGIAIYPSDGIDAAALLGNADAALHRAKAEGRGTMRFFHASMDERLRERRALQQDLQSALGRNEIVLHYQPQARINGEIIGFETLVRWKHPTRGMVMPDTFIPIAEESGLIISIGEWILREACREAATWPIQRQIAINLSPVQFRHGDVANVVHSVLLETGLAADRLELEITEGVLIGDFSRAVSMLRRLKSLGVRIAMDDFGTGYSSLSYLQSFPFDKIKIDKAFIANVERNPQSAAIVRAVIGLGHGLGMPIVAEGVETEAQRLFLARESCDEIQGYLVGRPQPISMYAAMVGRRPTHEPRLALVS